MLLFADVVLWVWGPITQKQLDLAGIDSACEGTCDVMELIGRLDANESTQSMLLDTFEDGLLHACFEQKWVSS